VAITTVAGYQNASNGALLTYIAKAPVNNAQTNGTYTSLWNVTGNPPQGAVPTAAATCTNATAGALVFTNPPGGVTSYITSFIVNGCGLTAPGALMAYDRLQHMGGLSGTVLTAQTVGLTVPGGREALADLSNVEWYVECYTDLGANSRTLTVSYTNTGSVSGQTVAVTIPVTYRAANMIRIVPTVAGDIIQSIDSCTLSASTGTAGNFGFTNLVRLAQVNATWGFRTKGSNAFQTGLPTVSNSACIAFAALFTGGSISTMGSIGLGVG
jgi:hypothetical protein